MPKVQFLFNHILAAMLAFFLKKARIVLYRKKQGIHKRITSFLQIAFCIGRQAYIHFVALGKLHLSVYIHFSHAQSECREALLGKKRLF
jgi:hypothetical protein